MKKNSTTNYELSVEKKRLSFYARANITLILLFIFSVVYFLTVILSFNILGIAYGKIIATIPSLIVDLFFVIVFYRYKLSYLLYLPILAQLCYIIASCGILLTL